MAWKKASSFNYRCWESYNLALTLRRNITCVNNFDVKVVNTIEPIVRDEYTPKPAIMNEDASKLTMRVKHVPGPAVQMGNVHEPDVRDVSRAEPVVEIRNISKFVVFKVLKTFSLLHRDCSTCPKLNKPDRVQKVKINHPRSVETDQEWSGEVAELDPTVQSKEFTFYEQANPRMLRTADNTKWENQMPELKVVDARAWVGMGLGKPRVIPRDIKLIAQLPAF